MSSVNGTSGMFGQSNTGSAPWGSLWFVAGGAFTPIAPAAFYGWFILTDNNGTNYEKSVANTVMPRAPDFVIPLLASAYAANDRAWVQGRFVQLPWENFKVFLVNKSGASLPSSSNLLRLGPVVESF